MNIRTFVAKSRTFVAKSAIWFSENEGGVKGRLELFRKFIRFGDAICPLASPPPPSSPSWRSPYKGRFWEKPQEDEGGAESLGACNSWILNYPNYAKN